MNKWCNLLLLVLFGLCALAQEPLRNDSIVKMVKAGLSADVIVSMVVGQPGQYNVSPDNLIALKSAGVPDRVVAAMVTRSSAGSVSGASSTGATPAAGASATGDPDDPLTPHDSGIYLYARDRNNNYKLIVLEQAAYQGNKTGGMFGAAMTYGIKKAKMKAVIPGQHASIRTSEGSPAFYFYFEDKAAGLGKGFGAASITNPSQFALIHLDITKNSRETVIGEAGAFGSSMGTSEKAMVTFKSEKIRPGLYKVVPSRQMDPGEYCFLSSYGGGAAAAAQIFDFAIGSDQ